MYAFMPRRKALAHVSLVTTVGLMPHGNLCRTACTPRGLSDVGMATLYAFVIYNNHIAGQHKCHENGEAVTCCSFCPEQRFRTPVYHTCPPPRFGETCL